MERITLQGLPIDAKTRLLEGLGYGSDGTHVLNGQGNRVVDPYVEVEVTLANVLILPGSTIILDNNPLSIAAYFEEYGDEL